VCDFEDNDCDDAIDEGVVNACGFCGPNPDEQCNGFDDDCDDQIDEGDVCEGQPVAPELGDLVINEIDYEQAGEDNAEFVEIFNRSDKIISFRVSCSSCVMVIPETTTVSRASPRRVSPLSRVNTWWSVPVNSSMPCPTT